MNPAAIAIVAVALSLSWALVSPIRDWFLPDLRGGK